MTRGMRQRLASSAPVRGMKRLFTTRAREKLAGKAQRIGVLKVLERLPSRASLLILNYHRIGRWESSEYCRKIFSTDAEGLDEEIRILKRSSDVLRPQEALDLIDRGLPLRRPATLLTFDDGYLDNYTTALPVLEAHGVSALFFLVTSYLDDPHLVSWWDRISALARHCVGKRISLSEPEPRDWVVSADNLDAVIAELLANYRAANCDKARFLRELAMCAGVEMDHAPSRLFMNWSEVSSLIERGMMIGTHTHTHPILAQMDGQSQNHEICHSKALLEERLGIRCNALAYPVGSRDTFTNSTKRIAEENGIRYAFSYDGGTNNASGLDRLSLNRLSFPRYGSPARIRSSVAMLRLSGRTWF